METYKNPNENYFNTPVAPPTVPTTITSQNTAPTAPISLPTMAMPQVSTLKDMPITDFIDTAPSALDGAKAATESRYDVLSRELFGKATATQAAETAAGIPQLTSSYNELNDQIRQLQAEDKALEGEYKSIPLQAQQDAQGKGITTGGLAPITTGDLRKNAIKRLALESKAGFISAMAETARGKIAQAEAQVDRAIKLKYEPIEQEIAYRRDALDRIDKNLSKEEEKKRYAEKIKLDERTRLLNIQKEDDKIRQGFIAQAIQQGAQNGTPVPPLVLSRAQQAGSPTEALALLSPYIVDKDAKAKALAELEQTRAQTKASLASAANSYANIAKTNAEIAALKNPPVGTVSQVTGKPLTDAERVSLGYAARAMNSDRIINQLGSSFTSAGSILGQFAPNVFKSSERQQYEQAQKDFISAVLRKESGAAISDSEFANTRDQYFPKAGDSQATVQQKAANRFQTIENLKLAGGQGASTSSLGQQSMTKSGKPFDVEAAKKAGYTQAEIDAYINSN